MTLLLVRAAGGRAGLLPQWLREPLRDRSWVLFVPLVAPHCPFQVEEPWFSRFDCDAVPDPAPPGDPSGEPR